jgi:hypothetical protein
MATFSNKDSARGIRQEGFDSLGLAFYLGKSHKGEITPKIKSSSERIRSKLKKVNDWCKAIRNKQKTA